MTNEAVIIELLGNPKGNVIEFNCANQLGIQKGTLCKLSGARTCAASTATVGEIFAGIAAMEKVANDGSTTISLYTCGIFDLTMDAVAAPNGSLLKLSGANLVVPMTTADNFLSGAFVGRVIETAAASDVVNVAVGVYY